ncbi:hypothetical protein [Bacillus cereus group sp. BfR-BA-01319]|uniref:hypothetical protein n=1 Tax=Bacillus cereus group sp. BfR-BA-01319 TaxID=2920296 RepID=UPI001F57F1C9|nr:hypothetical protein [Bacillus cereus group sp. BfR-BA-01319]
MNNSGKWSRLLPALYMENLELKPREVLPLEILAGIPRSESFRVIDVEWVSKDNVPVTLSKKNAIYLKRNDGFFYFDKLEICLFNSSNLRHATVDLYSIEEFYFPDGNTRKNVVDLHSIKELYFPDENTQDM